MNGIAKQAAFYRGYLTHGRSLVPLTIVLVTSVALWLIVYLVGALGGVPQDEASFESAESACALGINPQMSGFAAARDRESVRARRTQATIPE